MIIGRILWGAGLLLFIAVYLDSISLTVARPGQRYVRHAPRTRLVLAMIEVVLIGGAIALHLTVRPLLVGVPSAAFFVAGGVVAAAGSFLAVWAKIRLGRLFTGHLGVKEGHTLVTGGPYALVRHPIYLGVLIFFLGTAAVWNGLAFVLLALLAFPCLLVQLRVEERIFADYFGESFQDYRRRVPPLIPWFRS